MNFDNRDFYTALEAVSPVNLLADDLPKLLAENPLEVVLPRIEEIKSKADEALRLLYQIQHKVTP